MRAIRIDRAKPLAEQPGCGHNRFHPDIAPIVEVGEGEEVALETRDALDGQIKPGTTVSDFASLDAGAIHPLTGPVFIKGAAPGDILEIEFTDIISQPVAFSMIMPGLGFLRDVMTEPFLVHWRIRDGWATSAEIPGVRIPGAPLMGVSRGAPSARPPSDPPSSRGAPPPPPPPPVPCRRDPAASADCAPCRRARTAAIS